MEIITNKFEAKYGAKPSSDAIDDFALLTGYSCRMYWMRRTSKIQEEDFEMYRLLTNAVCPSRSNLPSDFSPKDSAGSLIFDGLTHKEMEQKVVQHIKELLNEKMAKQSFLSRIKSAWFV